MRIIRQTARDMRQALRAVREQLGEDAVILNSRRTSDGVEVTAAVDFDASSLEAGGFDAIPSSAAAPNQIIDAFAMSTASRSAKAAGRATIAAQAPSRGLASQTPSRNLTPVSVPAAARAAPARESTPPSVANNPTVLALTGHRRKSAAEPATASQQAAGAATYEQAAGEEGSVESLNADPLRSYDALASLESLPVYHRADDDAWISEAAREAVAEHVATPRAPLVVAPAVLADAPASPAAVAGKSYAEIAASIADEVGSSDPVEEVREATLTPLASNEVKEAFAQVQAPAAPGPHSSAATDAMGNELKTLRRMLETQLAHLAWNDLTRRAPVHTEILRELTEIGITQDLAEHLVRQLPEDTDLTFARRFTIAGLSQYLKVTGDHWLDEGGRVAFAGATGVGKTTTLAKIAVRWVLRHGPRDIALIAGDSVRIGAQDQLMSLAQLLGVPVYTPEKFADLPSMLSRLHERLILIDTPGSSVRDPQLASRLAVLSNSASKLQTALVLAASTQAGAIEEAVKHFAPANPSCCVLTKLDEAASLGGVLSVLIRARLPVSYLSEGQRVPEDLRPARALEMVSTAVRLAKARGAAADEDLLRRRFGRTAHGIS